MNSVYSDYLLFRREQIPIHQLSSTLHGYDLFLSAFNASERVQLLYSEICAQLKCWVVFAEYNIAAPASSGGSGEITVKCTSYFEDEAIQELYDEISSFKSSKVCIDATGFIRPHLLYLLRYLYEEGWSEIDIIYSEPLVYLKGSSTQFSGDIHEVRQVRGFEGSHTPATDGEYLIVGCGYDSKLMSTVANSKLRSTKIQMFPFPALRPHMYQENRVRTQESQDAFGPVSDLLFAPGHNPFATAHILSQKYEEIRPYVKNLYLSPLATKPQVLGFGLFYLTECIGHPISIIFPFSDRYNQETSQGISEVWRYKIELPLLRSIQKRDA